MAEPSNTAVIRETIGPSVADAVEKIIPHAPEEMKAALVTETAKAAARDPVAVNQMNMEDTLESRVTMFTGTAILTSIGMVANMSLPVEEAWAQIISGRFDWVMYGGSWATLAGAAYAFYGRVKPNLEPMKKWFAVAGVTLLLGGFAAVWWFLGR